MATGWESNPPMKAKSEAGSLFFKLGDGESAKVIIRGQPYTFYSIFENRKSQEVSKDHDGARFRFRVNVITKDASGYQAKILEGGARIFYDIKGIKDGGYDLDNTVLKISRTGMDKSTVWTVLPLPGGLDEKTRHAIGGIKLHELQNKKSKPESDDLNAFLDAPEPGWDKSSQNDEELPF